MKIKSPKETCGDMSGKEYDHLGHFRKEQHLNRGHNDSGSAAEEDNPYPNFSAHIRAQQAQQKVYDDQQRAYQDYSGRELSTDLERMGEILRGERPTRETNEQYRARKAKGGNG